MCISILWAFISQEPDSQWEHSGSSASHTFLLSLAYILQNVCAYSYPVRSYIWEKYNLNLCHHFNNLSTIFTFQVLNTLKGLPEGTILYWIIQIIIMQTLSLNCTWVPTADYEHKKSFIYHAPCFWHVHTGNLLVLSLSHGDADFFRSPHACFYSRHINKQSWALLEGDGSFVSKTPWRAFCYPEKRNHHLKV